MTTVFVTSAFAEMDSDDPFRTTFMIDNLEYQFNNEKAISWNAFAYAGYDLNKIYIYSDGKKAKEATSAESENQLVYSRAVMPYWDLQIGVGYDKNDKSNQPWGVIALQGLAPYFFETRVAALIGKDGNAGVRLESEYQVLITQKLILLPSLSTALYTKDAEEMGIGKGLSNLTVGARLRYEIVREFAPYIGIQWSKNFGSTNNFHPLNETYATVGLRLWF